MKNWFYILFLSMIFQSCGCENEDSTIKVYNSNGEITSQSDVSYSNTANDSKQDEGYNAYYKMKTVFEGEYSEEEVKKLIDAVMKKYDMPINDDNALRVGNMLLELRKASKVGVTEMEILKDMYQNGSYSNDMAHQAAISATKLELTK